MIILQRIAGLGRKLAGGETVAEMEHRLEQIPDEVQAAEAEIEANAVRRRAADDLVTKLTAEAAAGKLKDPARLTTALQQQREFQQYDEGTLRQRIAALNAEKNDIGERLYEVRRREAHAAYCLAVQEFAAALAPVRQIAQKVQELASPAGVLLGEGNSDRVLWIGPTVRVGGAVLDIKGN